MTDILIPLGAGSRHKNIELLYCLRSIEKHLTGVGNIFIVGILPDFINPETVTHIPLKDSPNNWERAHNIYKKIMAGVNFCYNDKEYETIDLTQILGDCKLSDNFLFMNDDHFLLTDYKASEFPYYHRGPIDLESMKHNRPQFMQYQNTLSLLTKYEKINKELLTRDDFGIHCPILYNKWNFEHIMKGETWPEHGYEIKSFYCNMINIKEEQYCEDLKFKEPVFMKESIYQVLEGRPWFSTGDVVLKNGIMQQVLNELYNNKSKYEF